jgi:2-oxoglutarate dehydrogenase E1 component
MPLTKVAFRFAPASSRALLNDGRRTTKQLLKHMEKDLDINCHNAQYVEWLLEEYARDKSSVPDVWQRYFGELSNGESTNGEGPNGNGFRPTFRPNSLFNPTATSSTSTNRIRVESERLQDRAHHLVRAYRGRGHLIAKLDPLGFVRAEPSELDPKNYGLQEADLDRHVLTPSVGGPDAHTLRQLIHRLRNTYCRYIGAQFMHIDDPEIREWLHQRMEGSENHIDLAREDQLRILTRLTDAVIFEQFVRKKYVGAKTFSLEGAESLIPLLDLAVEKAGGQGIQEIVMGMAHRGRLNVLANIIGKSPTEIFWEFEDPDPEPLRGRGDVKYHLGFSGNWTTRSGARLHLSLCFNPSHLEFINPVAMGRMRAKQDRAGDSQRRRGLVLLIHGDASFAGEGVVQETLNWSQLAGYTTGGALHVVVNNQLGFTTPPHQGRSTVYPTDVARMLQIPIFHVNGEHPEAVAQVVDMAMDFRERFQRDVVIDMFCYRRWGHNESDEASFTQPLLYQAIEHRPSVRDSYLEHLLKLGGVTRAEADQIASKRHDHLSSEFERVRRDGYTPTPHTLKGIWDGYRDGPEPEDDEPETGVGQEQLQSLLYGLTETPDNFHVHRKLQRMLEVRRKMAAGEQALDWAAAEALAIATLAIEGHRVRLAGQDTARGTFSQRHAVLHDVVDGHTHQIFQKLSEKQAPVDIWNSTLSEAGALGFEYGYSLDYPDGLVMWEAQYGDFINAAQVIVDQFIASAEDKWQRLSGLVLLLPHGFEGQGPEHSSARMERFLSLTAEHNIQVVNASTPAQYFHCLRRQVKRRWRKPIVMFTPKSLLRHRRVVSSLDELGTGRFQKVLADERQAPEKTSHIVLCTGKLYYELIEARDELQRSDVAIIRIEQIYPVADALLHKTIGNYAEGTPVVWAQEEPKNMGAWSYWHSRFGEKWLGRYPLSVVARPRSASPATGSPGAHKREQSELIAQAFEVH